MKNYSFEIAELDDNCCDLDLLPYWINEVSFDKAEA